MKKIFAAVILGTALTLTACGGNDEPRPEKTVYVEREQEQGGTEVEPETGNNQSAVEQEFIHDIGLYSTAELEQQSESDLIDLGYVICNELEEGATVEEIVRAGSSDGGLSLESMQTVVASSLVNFCPEFRTGGDVTTG